MGASSSHRSLATVIPEHTAEELVGALEAACGRGQPSRWRDPLDPAGIKTALDELLLAARPDRGLDVLVRSGVLAAVLPEVADLVGFGEGIRHKDVWMHTKQVVRQTPPRLAVRWAGLLHDIGKVPTRRFERSGQVTFIGHPEVGARMFARIARRLPFPSEQRDRVHFLIGAHLRAASYDPGWTDSAVRRFARDVGAALDDLLDLSRADITSKYPEKVRRGLRQIDLLASRVAALAAEDAKPVPLPTGLGTAIIERLAVAPGPALGRLMRRLREEVEGGRLEAQREFEHYLGYLADNPQLLAATRDDLADGD